MRSSASRARIAAVALVAALAPGLSAQSSQARSLYEDALARELSLRKEMSAHKDHASADALLVKVRALVGAYDDMSRLFPSSGYSDNALWQAATLSADAFAALGDAADRDTAARLFKALTNRFPSSSLAKPAPAQAARLTGPPAAPAPTSAASGSTTPASTAAPASSQARRATSGTVALTAIRHESLPDAFRVTLELDREVPFHDERLDGPPRVFLDLQQTRAVQALQDAILPLGDDIVQRVRVGRQLDSRTRVVLDLKAAARYSVYTLYNPYRVVVDFERGTAPVTDPRTASWNPAPLARTADARSGRTRDGRSAVAAAPPAPPAANTGGSFSLSRQLGLGVARIVVDAGHGGHDPGAKARGLVEAELVLDVALRLEALLLKQAGVEVVLTRRSDSYVALEERTAIANREGADLFLSIHANASADADIQGIETYFLNFAPNPAAEAVAARENAGAARPMRDLPEIVKAIALNNKIDESRDFAGAVQGSMYDRLRKVNRSARSLGVKQAPFMVLIGATMPSVLAEISFITNRHDASLLKTEKYRQQIAEALLAGIMKYQQSLKTPVVASK